MRISYKNDKLDIEQLVKDSSDKFSHSYDWDGFTLENNSFRVEYVRSDIAGYNRLYLDLFTRPFLRIEGGMDPKARSMDGFYASHLYVLNSDPHYDNSYVLAEAERQHSFSLKDMGGNEAAYNFVKGLQDFAKKSRKNTLVEPDDVWFENAANLFWTVGMKCGLYEVYDNWASQYKKPAEPKKGLLDMFKGLF